MRLAFKKDGSITRVEDRPGLAEYMTAQGWVEVPDPEPGVPEPEAAQPSGTEWITLYHPDVDSMHRFPNNAAAIEGAFSAGWVSPPTPEQLAVKPEAAKPEAQTRKRDSNA